MLVAPPAARMDTHPMRLFVASPLAGKNHTRMETAKRNADFQFAVSRISNPQGASMVPTLSRLEVGDTPGWKPALRAVGTWSHLRAWECFRSTARSIGIGLWRCLVSVCLFGIGWAADPGSTNSAALLAGTNELRITASARTFTWKEVTSPAYTGYVANLRAVGCPEERVCQVVSSDVNRFLDERRLDIACKIDFEWWKAGQSAGSAAYARSQSEVNLEKFRASLLTRLLGTNWPAFIQTPAFSANVCINLTGRVLGAMPQERFNAAAEICLRSQDRRRSYEAAHAGEGLPSDPVEEFQLRDQTRRELSAILTPAEMEEFLLRNSQNAENLRQNLRGFHATPEEFRKIFRALDPLENQMQTDYGSTAALSEKQREAFERQCNQAVRAVLPEDRFKAYLLTKDPIYRQAQAMAEPYLLSSEAIPRVYDLCRDYERLRQKLMQDDQMDKGKRNLALQALEADKQAAFQRIVQQDSASKKP